MQNRQNTARNGMTSSAPNVASPEQLRAALNFTTSLKSFEELAKTFERQLNNAFSVSNQFNNNMGSIWQKVLRWFGFTPTRPSSYSGLGYQRALNEMSEGAVQAQQSYDMAKEQFVQAYQVGDSSTSVKAKEYAESLLQSGEKKKTAFLSFMQKSVEILAMRGAMPDERQEREVQQALKQTTAEYRAALRS